MKVELIALWSIGVRGTFFGGPALEFSTLLEVTEAGTIHVHASCTMPTRCTPVLFGFLPRNFVKDDFLACLKSHAHLPFAYNICAKFQTDC